MTGPLAGLNPNQTMVGTANGVGLYVAPASTAAPTNLTTDFSGAWRPLGYASDDGVTIGGDISTESFTPWQSTVPIRTIITERTRTIGFTMWQLNQDTLSLYFGQALEEATDGVYAFDLRSDAPQQIKSIAVDVRDAEGRLRLVYPRATLESAGDMTLTRGAMIPLEVTLSALDDAGVLARVWISTPGGQSFAGTLPAEGQSNGGNGQQVDTQKAA